MDVVEAPRLSDLRAQLGTLVLVTLDPVSSVAALKDPEATAAAERLHPPTFMAFIQMATNVDWSKHASQQPLSFIFNFVMRFLPTRRPFSCVPLSPEGSLLHPTGRAPVIPSGPLPWSDCFIYTEDTFVVRVSRMVLTDPANICMLSKEQRRMVRQISIQDMQTPDPSHSPRDDPSTSSSESSEHESLRGPMRRESPRARMLRLQASEVPSGERRGSDTTSDSTDGDEGSSDEGSSDEESELPYEVVPSAELRLELSAAQDLGTIADYMDYMKKLHRIEQEWVDRTLLRELADQPDTQRWAADVAMAAENDPSSGVDAINATCSQSSLIVPESATASPTPNVPKKPDSPEPRHKRSLVSSVTKSVARRVKRAVTLVVRPVKLLTTRVSIKRRQT